MLSYSNIFPENIIAFTTLRDMDFFLHPDQHALTAEQCKYLSDKTDTSLPPVANIRQVHGNKIVVATKDYVDQGIAEDADALITNTPEIPIIIRTADCVPILMCAPHKKCVGVVHAGWKSTKLNIVKEAIDRMQSEWEVEATDLQVVLGPSILRCCYEVDSEFLDYFPEFVVDIDGRFMLDLPSVNKQQLLDIGVGEENISDFQECTCCSDKYFSFRKGDELSGRMVSLIMIKE